MEFLVTHHKFYKDTIINLRLTNKTEFFPKMEQIKKKIEVIKWDPAELVINEPTDTDLEQNLDGKYQDNFPNRFEIIDIISQIRTEGDELNEKFNYELKTIINQKIEQLDQKLSNRIEDIKRELNNRIDRETEKIWGTIHTIQRDINSLDKRLDQLRTSVAIQDSRIMTLDTNLAMFMGRVDSAISSLTCNFNNLCNQINNVASMAHRHY